MQYTVRHIPAALDAALRQYARATGKSLNQVVLGALAEGIGPIAGSRRRRNLADIAGTWKSDKTFETSIAAQHQLDAGLCR